MTTPDDQADLLGFNAYAVARRAFDGEEVSLDEMRLALQALHAQTLDELSDDVLELQSSVPRRGIVRKSFLVRSIHHPLSTQVWSRGAEISKRLGPLRLTVSVPSSSEQHTVSGHGVSRVLAMPMVLTVGMTVTIDPPDAIVLGHRLRDLSMIDALGLAKQQSVYERPMVPRRDPDRCPTCGGSYDMRSCRC